jgi:sugar phosphate isomerase/epimerase
MKKNFLVFMAILLLVSVSYEMGEQEKDLERKTLESVKEEVANTQYKVVRIKKLPVAIQCWTFRKFTFYETLEKVKELDVKYLQPYPGQALGRDFPGVRFDHNLSDDLIKQVRSKLKEYGLSLVSYGVVPFDNTEESMKKVFDFARRMGIRTIVTEPKFEDASLLEKMVKKYNINIAIHNHPDPSKYFNPETVFEYVKGLDERIGACADTGHWMRSGINPVEALRLLKGRIIDVHLKDLDVFGSKKALDVPFGQGKANVHDILAELTLQNFHGCLAIEHENPNDVNNPLPPMRKGIEYIQSITYYQDYEEILGFNRGRYAKHGWNHYGPGYFELDGKSGVLKGQGGMGLFWYSRKKYKDFVLDLEYMCADKFTNSGVFIRVPQMPASDEYIYHSFEIQICDNEKGIHKTGAAYDAEPPRIDAFKESGEWNHMKITFKGKNIKVDINGKQVLDWDAEPRGKIRDFSLEGYVGLQNHDSRSPIYFRNIFIKELK